MPNRMKYYVPAVFWLLSGTMAHGAQGVLDDIGWCPLFAVCAVVMLLLQGLLIAMLLRARRNERRMRNELSKSEQQWRSLTENLPDAIFRIDRAGNYHYVNPEALERSLKIKAGDLIGKTSRMLKLQDDRAGQSDIMAVFKDGRMRTVEERHPGGDVVLETRLVAERDGGGGIAYVLGISRDVTGERLAARELGIRQLILEHVNVAVLMLRRDWSVYFCNSSAAALLGIGLEELRGKNFMKLGFDPPLSELRVSDEVRLVRQEMEYLSPEGGRTPVEIILNRLEAGGETFFCVFLDDITGRRAHEDELRRAKEKAELSDLLKTRFLANMSHEVRTPLNGILGFAELLKYSDHESDDTRRYIDIIHDSGAALLGIIDDILDISKMESGQTKANAGEFVLDKLLSELHAVFSFKLSKDRGLELALIPGDDRGCVLCSDERMLRQILNNLIGNAIKFTASGRVEFGYVRKDQTVKIYVKDTGIGIPRDKHELIFEPFRQADDSIARAYGGTGLGLAIARTYARTLGGTLSLESEPGKGSTFYLEMPCRAAGLAAPVQDVVPASAAETRKYDWRGRKVLVVEDDRISFLFISKIISSAGARVVHAGGGRAAVSLCAQEDYYDAVLMDLMLPDIGGMEAAAEILKLTPDVPVLLQSANVALGGELGGCMAFLSKPINRGELLETLDRCFSGR